MRLSSVGFGVLGACLVIAGVVSLLLGVPLASREVAPLGSLSELWRRLPELSLPLSAAAGAIVAAIVSILVGAKRLRTRAGALELLILGVATEVALAAFAHRSGYAASGAVLVACVAALAGGVAIVVAAFAAAAAREDR